MKQPIFTIVDKLCDVAARDPAQVPEVIKIIREATERVEAQTRRLNGLIAELDEQDREGSLL